jgi:mitogen-activated protein kinase kinase
MSILELLHHIVNEPAPRLVSRSREFPASATSFIENCLDKEPSNRKSPQELLVSVFQLYNSRLTIQDFRLGCFRKS